MGKASGDVTVKIKQDTKRRVLGPASLPAAVLQPDACADHADGGSRMELELHGDQVDADLEPTSAQTVSAQTALTTSPPILPQETCLSFFILPSFLSFSSASLLPSCCLLVSEGDTLAFSFCCLSAKPSY